MTSSCSWCGKDLGEKCPACGAIAAVTPLGICFCNNSDCGVLMFNKGEGKSRAGICKPCSSDVLTTNEAPIAV